MTCKQTWLILGLIIAAAFVLRLYHLGQESLWFDETTTVYLARSSPATIIENAGRPIDSHPPLYNLFLYYWIRLAGDSEWSVRFPSVIFGVASVGIIFLVGRRLFDDLTGLLAALVLSVSWFHIAYSQEARSYALMTLLGLASLYFFIRLQSQWRWLLALGYFLATLGLLYSHVYGPFGLIAQNIYYFIQLGRRQIPISLRWPRWLFLQGWVVAGYIPWTQKMWQRVVEVQQTGLFIPYPKPLHVVDTLVTYASGSNVALLFFILAVVLALFPFRRKTPKQADDASCTSACRWQVHLRDSQPVLLLMVWLLTPIVLPYLISKVSTPIYYTRYTIAGSVAFYLLAVRGVRNFNGRYLRAVAILLIITLSLAQCYREFHRIRKDQWRQVAQFLDGQAQPADILIFNPDVMIAFNHYSTRTDLKKISYGENFIEDTRAAQPQLQTLTENHPRVWLVFWHLRLPPQMVPHLLPPAYELAHHQSFRSVNIFCFEKIPRKAVSLEVEGR